MTNEQVYSMAGTIKAGTDVARKDKKATIFWTHHTATERQHREQPDDRTSGRGEKKRKTKNSMDRQHLEMDRTEREEVIMDTARDRQQWKTLVHSCSQPSRSDDGEM